MQTKQFHVIPNTLFPCLPTPSLTSRPLHHQPSAGRHPINKSYKYIKLYHEQILPSSEHLIFISSQIHLNCEKWMVSYNYWQGLMWLFKLTGQGFLGRGVISTFSSGAKFVYIFQCHRTIENWKKQHSFFLFFLFFFSFFLFSFFLSPWAAALPAPLKWRPCFWDFFNLTGQGLLRLFNMTFSNWLQTLS